MYKQYSNNGLTVWEELANYIVSINDFDNIEDIAFQFALLIKDYWIRFSPKVDFKSCLDILYRLSDNLVDDTLKQILCEITLHYLKRNDIKTAIQLIDEICNYEYPEELLIWFAGKLLELNKLVDFIHILGFFLLFLHLIKVV